jgi:nicotinic acid mononucleotide adenylyltransferase
LLKLVFYTNDSRLKVRLSLPEDDFSTSIKWKNTLEFIVSDCGDYMMAWTSLLPDLGPIYANAVLELMSARYPISPEYKILLEHCPKLTFQNPNDEWVFFGGSFNPWHKGHQACLELLPEDRTCLVIPDRNPEKKLRDLSVVSTILEISTLARFKKHQYLVPTFLLQNKINPTVGWVEKLKEEFPTCKISLLMGFDSFSKIKNWIRCDDLLSKIHTLYVVSRLEDDEERRIALDEVHAQGFNVNVVFLGKHDFEMISSTELRGRSSIL